MNSKTHSRVALAQTASWRDYLCLCKPKVVLMILITTMVGMYLASGKSFNIELMLIATVAIGFAASAAAVINHVIDVKIDTKMQRTQWRPMVNQRVSTKQALCFSAILVFTAMFLLLRYVNALTACLTLLGFIGYACVYSCYLKHHTPQNIVFGGFAGAIPPLLGWTSVANDITLEPILLTLIIFLWTPAHFWPLAIDRLEDYKQANVPMLPVVKGVHYTKNCIIAYTLATVLASLLPVLFHYSGLIYLSIASGLGLWFGFYAVKLKITNDELLALQTFRVSIYYLIALFLALLVDHFVVFRL